MVLDTDFYVFLVAMIISIVLLFIMVWHLIMVDELKNDYRNPLDFCQTMNRLVLPEYLLHAFVTLMMLLCGYWFTCLFNIPLVAYHVWRYTNRPTMSGPGLYDATIVMNRAQLSLYTKEGFVKIGFYVLSFLVYLFHMMVALVTALT